MAWYRQFIKTHIPNGATTEQFDRRVVEALVTLHRFRNESFIGGRKFFTVRNRNGETEVGFADDSFTEQMLAVDPLASRVSSEALDMLKQVLA